MTDWYSWGDIIYFPSRITNIIWYFVTWLNWAIKINSIKVTFISYQTHAILPLLKIGANINVYFFKKAKQIHVYMRFNITKCNYWIAWKEQTLIFFTINCRQYKYLWNFNKNCIKNIKNHLSNPFSLYKQLLTAINTRKIMTG